MKIKNTFLEYGLAVSAALGVVIATVKLLENRRKQFEEESALYCDLLEQVNKISEFEASFANSDVTSETASDETERVDIEIESDTTYFIIDSEEEFPPIMLTFGHFEDGEPIFLF